jgi:hypothetical protein
MLPRLYPSREDKVATDRLTERVAAEPVRGARIDTIGRFPDDTSDIRPFFRSPEATI